MPKSRLDPHAELILDLLVKEADNGEILDILLAKSVDTSQEGVRTWINRNADPKLLKDRGKGRKRKPKHARFSFIPDHRDPMDMPAFLEAALSLFSGSRSSRLNDRVKAAEAFVSSARIKVDPTIPPWQWILPAKSLAALADVELLLLAYLLSDRTEPPSRGTTSAYQSWLVDLMRDAAKLRAKINESLNFRFEEI